MLASLRLLGTVLLFLLAIGIARAAGSGSPEIFEWSRTAGAGEVVSLTGSNLRSVAAFVRSGGNSRAERVTVERSSRDVALVRLPATLPGGAFLRLWVRNDRGSSQAVLINAPELWWVGPDEAAPGDEVSLFGRNLTDSGGFPDIRLRAVGGRIAGRRIWLPVLRGDGNRVIVRLPRTLRNGAYAIELRRRSGTAVAWTSSQPLRVHSAWGIDWAGNEHAVLSATRFGATPNDDTDDSEALQAALDAAQSRIASRNGEDEVTVLLERGSYLVSHALILHDRVELLGRGAGATLIQATPDFASTGAYAGQPHVIWTGEFTTGEVGSRIRRLAVSTGEKGGLTAIRARGAEHLTMEGVKLLARNGTPLEAHASSHLRLLDSVVVGRETFLGSARQVLLTGNSFYGSEQASANITTFGASEVVIEKNTGRHLNNNPSASAFMTEAFQGRFFVAQPHWSQPVNQYIAGNRTYDLAPHVRYRDQGLHVNSGEQILFEGAGLSTLVPLGGGLLVAAGSVWMKFDRTHPAFRQLPDKGLMTIVSGKGAGATSQIKRLNAAAGTYLLSDPLSVPPDTSSVVVINRAPSRVIVVGNRFDGRSDNVSSRLHTASAGVQLYDGGSRVVISRNVFSDLRVGVSLWTAGTARNYLAGPNFLDVSGNVFRNVNFSVAFFVRREVSAAEFLASRARSGSVILGTAIVGNNFAGSNRAAVCWCELQGVPARRDQRQVAAGNLAFGNIVPIGKAGELSRESPSLTLWVKNNRRINPRVVAAGAQ